MRFGIRTIPALLLALLTLTLASLVLARSTLAVRYERDVSRMVFNDNTDLLEDLRRRAGLASDSLSRALASRSQSLSDGPYIVVSIADHQLWYRRGDSILFSAPVTTGSGKVLEGLGADRHWKFETPRGRLMIVSKEKDPVWVAPDWHYAELAQTRGLGIRRINRGQRVPTADSGQIAIAGSDVVRIARSGVTRILPPGTDDELVVDGNVIVPPFGTNQRRYKDVLGTRRLNLGQGYAIHGTNAPEQIGRSVSHGCIRLKNEDIESLFEIVQLGTPVFIY